MNFLVPRTCTEVFDSSSGRADTSESEDGKPLSDYRSASAYVLLGNPGFGKTTEFERESRESTELGGSALMVSARDFITFDVELHPEWRDKILFIDGLDEVRSGVGDARIPLDEIRHRLDRLRPPAFRISCREADWLDHSDRDHLGRVSNDQQVTVLRLDELEHDQILELLRRRHGLTAEEAQAFIAEARHRGVDGLLANPLTLGLLVDAVEDGQGWPDGRCNTLEMACLRLATEHNGEHAIGSQVEGRPRPQTVVDAAGYVFQREEQEFERQMAEEREQWQAEQRQIQEDWTIHLREHERELRENRFAPQHLHELAKIYLYGFDHGPEDPPHDRISNFLGGNRNLVDAVMLALRGTPRREELPEVTQTISLSLESRQSTLAYPVLAGIDLVDKEDPGALDGLSNSQKRKVLAIYYCVPHSVSAPHCFRRWLTADPQMVLDVLFECAVAEVRAGKSVSHGLRLLEGVEGFDEMVNDVRLRLLDAFPTRSSKSQLKHLDPLLSGALEYRDNAALLSLARRKQSLSSMPIAQRVRWWMTDALISQDNRLGELRSELAKNEVRIRHLAEFLTPMWRRFDNQPSVLSTIGDPVTLENLIGILGRLYPPPRFASGSVTLGMEMSELISTLVDRLGEEPGEKAEQALGRLVADPELEGWRRHLQGALEGQRVISRDASYRRPSLPSLSAPGASPR